MEQTPYWMWTKRRHGFSNSHLHASTTSNSACDDSWEEQAFAEDAAGSHGGCIWPPRSYSCSFCRREFRSAQALGGHMNVHRRDRARLKQSPCPDHSEILPQENQNHHNHIQNPLASFDFRYPSQFCAFVYSSNPNSDHDVLPSSLSSPPRVSVPYKQAGKDPEQTFFPSFAAPIIQEDPNKSLVSSTKSGPCSFTDKHQQHSDLRTEGDKSSRILESAKLEYTKNDMSLSLNLVVHRSCSAVVGGKEEHIGRKKRKRFGASSQSFLLQLSSDDEHHDIPTSEKLELSPRSFDDLDLELRLGDPPKVK